MLEHRMKNLIAGFLVPAIAITIGVTVWGLIAFALVHFVVKFW